MTAPNESVTLYTCPDCDFVAMVGWSNLCPTHGVMESRVFVPAGTGGAVGESRVEYRVVGTAGPKPGREILAYRVEGAAARFDEWNREEAPHRVESRTVTSGPWTTEGGHDE